MKDVPRELTIEAKNFKLVNAAEIGAVLLPSSMPILQYQSQFSLYSSFNCRDRSSEAEIVVCRQAIEQAEVRMLTSWGTHAHESLPDIDGLHAFTL